MVRIHKRMNVPENQQLEQLLEHARGAFSNAIDPELLNLARIEKGWISQRAVVEEYYRLLNLRERRAELPEQKRWKVLFDFRKWLVSVVGGSPP